MKARGVAPRLCLAVVASLAAALPAACGRKTDVKPPELAAPEVVTGIAARNVAEGVRLSWHRPRLYVDGSTMRDLAGFLIERGRDEEPFAKLTELVVSDRDRFRKTRRFRFVDTNVETGRRYRYVVRAFTVDGHLSAPSAMASVVRESVPAPEGSRARGSEEETVEPPNP